jgi:hypothetical protein
VARHRLAGLLASTAVAAAMSFAAGQAHAQASAQSFTSSAPQAPAQVSVRDSQGETRDPSVPSLFDPHFEERDGRAQRFRKPGAVATVSSGAGTTGFDATHSRARRKARADAQKRARAEAENLPPLVPSGPDRTVAPVFQREESRAATRRRAINTAAAPLDAAGAIAARPIRRRIVDDDPFAPVGFYRGTFLVKPALELSGGYNSNPGQRLDGKGSTFEQATSEFDIKSNWSQHELSANLKGSYIWYNADKLDNLSKPDINLRGAGRIDITKQTKADFEGRFQYAADNPGDPNLPTDVASPPIYTISGGTVGIRHAFNRLELSLKGAIDSTSYADAKLNNGELLSQRDRNYDQYGTKIRASYETLPGVIPFVEYGADERKHDLAYDIDGVNRDSSGQSIRVGSTFRLTGYLVGEFAVGWLERSYVDPIFSKLHGSLIDASLTYYATPLTTLKLDVKTTVDESTLNGVSGGFTHDYSLQVEHAFRRWLLGTVKMGYANTIYEGSPRVDDRYIASAAMLYKLSRDLWLKGEYRREWLESTDATANYVSNIFTVGLRLQR